MSRRTWRRCTVEEVVDQVSEAFKMPWVQGSNGVIEELRERPARRLRKGRGGAQARSGRSRPVERALVEQRHYRKRW